MKYYRLDRILKYNAKYNVIFGERSNGKSYAVHEKALIDYVATGAQFAVVRRWQDDFTGKRGQSMFNGIVESGLVESITGGEWTGIYYYSSRWYLCRYEDGKRILNDDVFAYGFAITSQEHDKSTSYPRIKNILFDEFLSRTGYVPDEFILFSNVLSTIIRERDDVTIFMLGNTVNRFCPYYKEMGLNHVAEMKQGTIDLYRYGESGLTVAVEYVKSDKKGKKSDVYFAFDNPKLNMITSGTWEIDIYPHCPTKYRPKDVCFTYFIEFDEHILQCEIVTTNNGFFTFIHPKTGNIKHPESDLLFTLSEHSHLRNVRRDIKRPEDKLGVKIYDFFKNNRVFYADNETGEIVMNYLKAV